MKKTTLIKYETSDGRSFQDARPAQEHEVGLLAARLNGGATRLTAAELIRLMCDNSGEFIALLLLFGEDAPDAEVGIDTDTEEDEAAQFFEKHLEEENDQSEEKPKKPRKPKAK